MLTASLFESGQLLKDELTKAPNPKPTSADKSRFGKLASLYTAFSGDFAVYALDVCTRMGCSRIADPFAGTGTLAEAGRKLPVELQLGDISPFAVLSCAFRSAPREAIERSVELIHKLSIDIAAPDERVFFRELFTRLGVGAHASVVAHLTNPSDPEYRTVALTIFLAALSRIHLYKRLGGSNPTWFKRPEIIADRLATLESIRVTIAAVREFARHLPDVHPENQTSPTWTSIESNPIAAGSLDAIVTSPPYSNRTDYIRHYFPASELLLAAAGRDERLVRAGQISTPLIRKDTPQHHLPAIITDILNQILKHPSYASKRYCYKGFLYYFSDMLHALERMHSWLRERGVLLMIVQDTYYKDIYVPTADMLIQLADSVGFKLAGRRDWRVLHHLSRLTLARILGEQCRIERCASL